MKAYVIAIAALLLAIGTAQADARPESVKTTCFSARSWDANDADRPCTTLVAPDNDIVRVVQGTASREQAECRISITNVQDARCHRIPADRADVSPLLPSTGGPHQPQAICTTDRLCAAVHAPQEDGSGRVTIYVGARTIRCMLSNPTEERGRYLVPCFSS